MSAIACNMDFDANHGQLWKKSFFWKNWKNSQFLKIRKLNGYNSFLIKDNQIENIVIGRWKKTCAISNTIIENIVIER